MKICTKCYNIFNDNGIEHCSYCGSYLYKVKFVQVKDGKFEGEYESEKKEPIYIIKGFKSEKLK